MYAAGEQMGGSRGTRGLDATPIVCGMHTMDQGGCSADPRCAWTGSTCTGAPPPLPPAPPPAPPR
jgi:hypothetical protein